MIYAIKYRLNFRKYILFCSWKVIWSRFTGYNDVGDTMLATRCWWSSSSPTSQRILSPTFISITLVKIFTFKNFKVLMGFAHHLIWYGILELFYIQIWTENLIPPYIRWVTFGTVIILIWIFKNALINGTDGSVEWMPPGIFRTKCTIDIKSWGFRHLSVRL